MKTMTVNQLNTLISALIAAGMGDDGITVSVHTASVLRIVGDAPAGGGLDALPTDTATPYQTAETPAPAAGYTAADFPVGSRINWSGVRFAGAGEVIKHSPDGSVSVRIHDTATDASKRVNLNAADVASGRLVMQGAVDTPADPRPVHTAADFPVGSRINWNGALFQGAGTVVSHNDDGSVSVRIYDVRSARDKKVNLNAADINSGNLLAA